MSRTTKILLAALMTVVTGCPSSKPVEDPTVVEPTASPSYPPDYYVHPSDLESETNNQGPEPTKEIP